MATSQQQAPQEKRLFSNHRAKPCNQAKPYISRKRNNTWSWQDRIYASRTRTTFAERGTHGCPYLKWIGKLWANRANKTFRKYIDLQEPQEAICYIFGSYCREALAVAWCESRHHITAENGQYLGMFQMGSSERARYGHGNTPLEQAVAAHRYFEQSGRDWSPWSCKP